MITDTYYGKFLHNKIIIIFVSFFALGIIFAFAQFDAGLNTNNTNNSCTSNSCQTNQPANQPQTVPADCPINSSRSTDGGCYCISGYVAYNGNSCVTAPTNAAQGYKCDAIDFLLGLYGCGGSGYGYGYNGATTNFTVSGGTYGSGTSGGNYNLIRNNINIGNTNTNTPGASYSVSGGNVGSGTSGGSYNLIGNNIAQATTTNNASASYSVSGGNVGSGTSGGSYNLIGNNIAQATTTNNSSARYSVSGGNVGSGTSGGNYNLINNNLSSGTSRSPNPTSYTVSGSNNFSNSYAGINNNNSGNAISQNYTLSTKTATSTGCAQISCYATFSGSSNTSALAYFQILDINNKVLSESGKVDVTGKTDIKFTNTFNGVNPGNYMCRSMLMLNGYVTLGDTKNVKVDVCSVSNIDSNYYPKIADTIYTKNDKR